MQAVALQRRGLQGLASACKHRGVRLAPRAFSSEAQDEQTPSGGGSGAETTGGREGPADLQSRYMAHQTQLQEHRHLMFPGIFDRALLDEKKSDMPVPWGFQHLRRDDVCRNHVSLMDRRKLESNPILKMVVKSQNTDDIREGTEQAYRKLVDIYNGEGWLSNDGTVISTTPFEDSGLVLPGLAHALDRQLHHTRALGYRPYVQLASVEEVQCLGCMFDGREPAAPFRTPAETRRFTLGFGLAIFGLSRSPERYALCSILEVRTRERSLFYSAEGIARPEQAAGSTARGKGQASHADPGSAASGGEEVQELKAPEGGPLGVPLFGDAELQERTHLLLLHRVPGKQTTLHNFF
eukprot:TRINITY_DN3755_c0_g1_i1.p1 TRINITY_DN3755_c0_g1~~TRINITY_DN3755_c0_g1_i1.p1  ORF type:complete len:368 (-),score=50.62 TRINITY_DN3755_c0_g1_i1:1417-2472(-)